MVKRTALCILATYILLSISCFAQEQSPRSSPDEIRIYKLPQFSCYLVGVDCDRVKRMSNVVKKVIKSRREIKKLTSLFEDSTNFTLYRDYQNIDSRILIEYLSKGQIVKQICWSQTHLVQKDGRVYFCNQKVEKYLNEKGLIILFNFKKDSIGDIQKDTFLLKDTIH